MKDIKVVIGSNFGDEGKGLMTNYFVQQYKDQPVLNVRFNGGAQAGHTVCTDNGKRTVFNHFGAGSFNKNCSTFLSSHFVVNPIIFMQEIFKLRNYVCNGNPIYIHKDCIVTLPCDIIINQIAEDYRNENRHGSCGLGVWETVVRNRDYARLTIGDIQQLLKKGTFKRVVNNIVNDYCNRRLIGLCVDVDTVSKDDSSGYKNLTNGDIIDAYTEDLENLLEMVEIVNNSIYNQFNCIVFEGAQGLLLDWESRDYFPNITASYTGMKNVAIELESMGDYTLEVCYVTRSYFTRHGEGRLNTECKSSEISSGDLFDKTNIHNKYQGHIRYGLFDLSEFQKAIYRDSQYLPNRGENVVLAVTHLDETGGKIVSSTGLMEPYELPIHVKYCSYCEISDNVLTYVH